VLLAVGVLVAPPVTVTMMTMTVVTAATVPTLHHVVASSGVAAVRVLPCEDNTAKADKDECYDSDNFLLQLSYPPNKNSKNEMFLRLMQKQVNA
jgi:hypothetical protein